MSQQSVRIPQSFENDKIEAISSTDRLSLTNEEIGF